MTFTSVSQAKKGYAEILREAEKESSQQVVLAMREMVQHDLFFLLLHVLNRKDIDHPWLFDRCREVQEKPNGNLDLWAREHYKSTIITFGLTIQDILNDPEITIGIFSFNRPIAKGFLRQIMREFELNEDLRLLYPDILWEKPERDAAKWSEDDGLIVKRKTNPKESTLEAWGLVDSMPTSRHFQVRIYDDLVTERFVSNAEMVKKAIRAWELSLNLGSQRPLKHYKENNIQRYVGTRYRFNDPYREIISRGVAKERKHPGTIDGKVDGEPVFWPKAVLQKKRVDMGPYVFGCQILQDPKADEVQGFKPEWLRFWKPNDWSKMNLYLLCDPAGEKKKENDYTVMLVIGLGEDNNYYLVDGIRDRLNLTERTNRLMQFHREYKPLDVGYEKYGKDSDIEHIQYVQERENYRFHVTELGGATPKNDRIRKMIPVFEQGRFYIPERLLFVNHERKDHDLIREFLEEEYSAFPVGVHDDVLDCMARVVHEDLHAKWPSAAPKLKMKEPKISRARTGGWMV